jgi:phosphatidylserine decarboxylase
VYQGFLNPWCYHRWHAPVSGIIEKTYYIPGYFFYSNPYLNPNYEHNYCTSQPILSATSCRQIYIIKADNPKIGRIGIV